MLTCEAEHSGVPPVRGKGALLPPMMVRRTSSNLSPACGQRTSDVFTEEGFHGQEAHAPEFPRELEEGSEALAQGASRERRGGPRATRARDTRRPARAHLARHPARAGARARVLGMEG